jgi:2-amino-4-hydroxy-6-hydroxymethyldihydropteridine diphosphokinase
MRVGIALGSNLGDRMANLRAARSAIVHLVGDKNLLASPVYETEPIDCEPGAGKFLNAVLEIEYDNDPVELLEHMIRIEESLGRKRDHDRAPSSDFRSDRRDRVARNLSREIDLDLLYADDLEVENERLRLPHPRMHLRRFVLRPLADIRPDLVLPGHTQTVRELLAQLKDSGRVSCFAESW